MKQKLKVSGLAAVLAAVLLVCCLPIALSAQSAPPVTLSAPAQAQVGDTVEVHISANQPLADGKLVLTYPSAALEYAGTQPGEAWTSGSGQLVYEANGDTAGRVALAFAAEDPCTQGTIFTVEFTASGAGTATVALGSESYVTGVSGSPSASASVTVVDGSTAPTPTPTATPSPEPTTSPEPTPTPSNPGAPGPGAPVLPPVTPSQPPEDDTECDGGPDCPSVGFTDVDAGLWYHEAVDYMVENGLMVGTTATTFSPGTGSTRGMLITILYRYAGSPQVQGDMPFSDVAENAFYHDAVLWAFQNNIAQGVGAGTFGPSELITREQLAAFLYRYAQFSGRDTSAQTDLSAHPDAGQISGWAGRALSWAVAEGIVQGGSNSMIMPQDTATRAHIAAMVFRFAEGA
ncbi:MAG TPA: S-layer homology domain-containing protein [Candidatus Enterenecus stercoripullorum]|nr:S-layer homology domain-containing protein [Candidatus Enterenecus stercoripullorum]